MDAFLPLTTADRTAIISDIASWKQELHMNDNDFTHEEYDDYVDDLHDLEGQELLDFWMDTVGEWILSRDDVHRVHLDGSGEQIVSRELRRLLNEDEETTYGYVGGRTRVSIDA